MRREVKKFQELKPGDDVVGYKNVGELCKDVEELVGVLWFSGTRMATLSAYCLEISQACG